MNKLPYSMLEASKIQAVGMFMMIALEHLDGRPASSAP